MARRTRRALLGLVAGPALAGAVLAGDGWDVKIIGRMQLDAAGFEVDPSLATAKGPFESGVKPRRARLGLQAERERWTVKTEWDHAGNDLALKDGFLAYRVGGDIYTVGHHKEYFGLEQWTSTKYTTFVERASPDVLTPARNTGLSFRHNSADGRSTWGIGRFEERNGLGHEVSDPGSSVTGRVTHLPWREGPDKLLHVGLSVTRRSPGTGGVRYRSRPEVSLGPRLVDTKKLLPAGEDAWALEAAWVNGPLSLQGEVFHHSLDLPSMGDPDLGGWYLFASWFPTGEHRVYKQDGAAFVKVKPKRKSGAIELALRVSELDFTDAGLAGGEMDGVTAGVNVYFDAYTRFQLNWNRSELAGFGEVETVSARVGVFF